VSAAAARSVRGAEDEARVQAALRALAAVPDPELPALTLADLGIVRFVNVREDGTLDVGLSPTYTGSRSSRGGRSRTRGSARSR